MNLEVTLAILKPHVMKATHALKNIHKMIKDSRFVTVKSSTIQISSQQIENFYEEHKNKFFYNRLITSMVSGECEVIILAKVNAIQEWRQLMGPTKVYQTIFTHPDSIRGQFGLTDTRNATHGSDSNESAAREISIFFPDFNISKWLNENKDSFKVTKPTKIDQSTSELSSIVKN